MCKMDLLYLNGVTRDLVDLDRFGIVHVLLFLNHSLYWMLRGGPCKIRGCCCNTGLNQVAC